MGHGMMLISDTNTLRIPMPFVRQIHTSFLACVEKIRDPGDKARQRGPESQGELNQTNGAPSNVYHCLPTESETM